MRVDISHASVITFGGGHYNAEFDNDVLRDVCLLATDKHSEPLMMRRPQTSVLIRRIKRVHDKRDSDLDDQIPTNNKGYNRCDAKILKNLIKST